MMNDIKERVRAAVSIADIAAEWYKITLNNRGRGVCPFCKYEKDKTTFWVSDNGQGFQCHHCGKKGDLFTLVMEMDNLEFPSALKKLAYHAGIEWKTTPEQAGKIRKAKDKETALQRFAKYWNKNLTAEAVEYLKNRKIEEAYINRNYIGYIPENAIYHSDKQDFPYLKQMGLMHN